MTKSNKKMIIAVSKMLAIIKAKSRILMRMTLTAPNE